MNYEVCDEIVANACKHCAPLFIIENKIPLNATPDDLSATITFV